MKQRLQWSQTGCSVCVRAGSDEAAVKTPKRSVCIQISQPLSLLDLAVPSIFVREKYLTNS